MLVDLLSRSCFSVGRWALEIAEPEKLRRVLGFIKKGDGGGIARGFVSAGGGKDYDGRAIRGGLIFVGEELVEFVRFLAGAGGRIDEDIFFGLGPGANAVPKLSGALDPLGINTVAEDFPGEAFSEVVGALVVFLGALSENGEGEDEKKSEWA